MTIEPRKIRELALLYDTLSKSAPTAEERDIFAKLALKWSSVAHNRQSHLTLNPLEFDDEGVPSSDGDN